METMKIVSEEKIFGLKASLFRLDNRFLMKSLFIPKECNPDETRVALIPSDTEKFVKAGWSVNVESSAGEKAGFSDADYAKAGAKIVDASFLKEAEFVASVGKPTKESIDARAPGSFHLSLLDPFNEKELLKDFAAKGVNAASFEMIPRSTIAQKMDVLSSQSNLAGYYAVIKAAETINKAIPMMMTPAGTISPLKFFIVGVGVAGLQAIATAKRLGGRVEAFDTRPVVEEQVKSLGAKFVKIDLGETGQTAQGYAKELTPEQIELQRKGMAKVCAQADVIITTAKVFGRKAPRIITAEMVAGMKPGSVIVDMAAESGGNVEGTVAGEEIKTPNGVLILGIKNLEGKIPASASQMFSANVRNFIEHFSTPEDGFKLDIENPILKSAVVVYNGNITDERFK